jgi:hypothetical protein
VRIPDGLSSEKCGAGAVVRFEEVACVLGYVLTGFSQLAAW